MANRSAMFDRIEANARIQEGKPVIKGSELPIYEILEAMAQGRTIEEILKAYPFIQREDILQALGYAARLINVGIEEP